MKHTIHIVVHDDGSVTATLDGELKFEPACERDIDAQTIDGQAKNVLDRALLRILSDDFAGRTWGVWLEPGEFPVGDACWYTKHRAPHAMSRATAEVVARSWDSSNVWRAEVRELPK
jgi:hypothetical protein